MSGLRSHAIRPALACGTGPGIAGRGLGRRLGWLLGLLIGVAAFGADDDKVFTPGASRAEAPAASAGASLSSISLVLAFGLAAAGGWMVWRNRRGTASGRDLRALAIDETRPLGNRQYLVVASYEGKKFLIGVCPGRIEMLSPLESSAVKEKLRE